MIAGGVHSPFVFSVFIPWYCPEFRDARGTLDRVRAVFSRPQFIDAAFPVGGEDAQVTLHIKY